MKRWLQRLGDQVRAWMHGRYGYDELSKFLSIVALVCIFISPFLPLLNVIALILLFGSMFRSFSRNLEKRQK